MIKFSSKRTFGLALALVAGLQTAALCYIVFDRVMLLKQGREIVAEVIPVDPRDIFRGDYVTFGYAFAGSADHPVPETTRTGDALFVTLKPNGPEAWEIAAISDAYPASVPAEQVVLKGRVLWLTPKTETSPAMARFRFGIESYFVPEGKGRDLEQEVREHKIAAVLAVGAKGDVAIKGLKIDGKLIAEEPLL